MLFPLALQGAQREEPRAMVEGKNILVTLYTAAELCLKARKPVLQVDSSTLTSLCRLGGAESKDRREWFCTGKPIQDGANGRI